MSVYVMSRCWSIQLPHVEKLVLISLADQANDHGECWPSIASMQKRTGLSERSLQRTITSLESKGLVIRNSRPGHSNRYLLPDDAKYPFPDDANDPRQRGTPVSVAPRQRGTPPPSHSHPTPVSVAPHPRQAGTQNRNRTINEPSKNRKRFERPSLDELTSFVKQERLNVEPEAFIDYFESVGWMVGRGKPMKDWKSAARGWSRRHVERQPQQQINQSWS